MIAIRMAETRANWLIWKKIWDDRYGETMEVSPMSHDDHERIDPLSELAEKMHPDNIIQVQP